MHDLLFKYKGDTVIGSIFKIEQIYDKTTTKFTKSKI